jgi:hypothetical protein
MFGQRFAGSNATPRPSADSLTRQSYGACSISLRLDGRPGAASVTGKRRRVLYNIAEYALERKCLTVNPIPTIKWKAPKASGAIDSRTVVNPVQARVLLDAVRQTRRSGPRLVAFFALM